MDTFTGLVGSLGFPIVVAGFLLWERYTINRKLDRKLDELIVLLRQVIKGGS